jgi:hypothetical protein
MTKKTETKYSIRNWSEYNKALVNRGSLTIWFSEDVIEKWFAKKTGKRGRPFTYSEEMILVALIVKAVYKLPFRGLRGFIISILQCLSLGLRVPCYTRICRRAGTLGQKNERLSRKKPKDIVFDSSGLKVYGEGEWKVKKHGKSKRRTWRKIHIGMCPDSHELMLCHLTENSEGDSEVIPQLGPFIPRSVDRVYADGAYDAEYCYQEWHIRGITPLVPPQRGAVLHDLDKKPWMRHRNDAILAIRGLGNDDDARKLWKVLAGYHRRSLGETAFYRWKTIFGSELKTRKIRNQKGEVYAKAIALNRMNALGMPKGKWVAA